MIMKQSNIVMDGICMKLVQTIEQDVPMSAQEYRIHLERNKAHLLEHLQQVQDDIVDVDRQIAQLDLLMAK